MRIFYWIFKDKSEEKVKCNCKIKEGQICGQKKWLEAEKTTEKKIVKRVLKVKHHRILKIWPFPSLLSGAKRKFLNIAQLNLYFYATENFKVIDHNIFGIVAEEEVKL